MTKIPVPTPIPIALFSPNVAVLGEDPTPPVGECPEVAFAVALGVDFEDDADAPGNVPPPPAENDADDPWNDDGTPPPARNEDDSDAPGNDDGIPPPPGNEDDPPGGADDAPT